MTKLSREASFTLAGVFIGLFLAALDQTIIAMVLPSMLEELQGEAWYGWVGVAYLLGSTLTAPIIGRLVEIRERKSVLIAALGIFWIGSALCGLSNSIAALMAFRLLQGAGAGALIALAFTTLAWFFPPRERSRWAGVVGALFGVASAIGPIVGGYIAEHISWRWAFWLNLPVLLVAMGFVVRFLPPYAPPDKGKLDLPGAFLLAGWTSLLLLGFSYWNLTGTLGAPTFAMSAGAMLLLLLWIRTERKQESPLFQLHLLQTPTFRYAALTAFFFGGIFLGGVVFFPLYLEKVLGFSPVQGGLLLLSFTIGAVLSTGAAGAWVSRHGRYKPLLLIAGTLLAVAFGVAALYLPAEITAKRLIPLMIAAGMLLGPFQALLSVIAQNDIPLERVGSATSALQFMRQVGATILLALLNHLYLIGAHQTSLLMGIRWVFGGAAILSLLMLGVLALLPDKRLRAQREAG
ncbi:MAG: MFS transporter [Bacteroidia bacterium]|nr:MFS transporter [Bacteroidia bacterium]MDW8235192.1 MFS transporter [Bacteroidia bacterium]